MSMNKDIKEILLLLFGKKVCSVWRKSYVLWLEIGDTVEKTEEDGKIEKKSEFALEVQSAWRIVNNHKKKIILASSDVFSPNSKLVKEKNLDWTTFEWNIPGNNMLDEKLNIWFSESPIYIVECKISVWGNLLIRFSNNDFLEIFVDTSDYVKCWILSDFQKKEEWIVTGLGYEFQCPED